MSTSVGAVVVTHESEHVAPHAVRELLAGTRVPDQIVVVDNASSKRAYLDEIAALGPRVRVLSQSTNLGFCAGNNLGVRALSDPDAVLFLNPDAFVTAQFLEDALARLAGDARIGAVGPKLVHADPVSFEPSEYLDSAGIAWTAYGRAYDRGQGELDRGQFDGPPHDVPALCAAALLCRRSALDAVAADGQVFDETFFMYKEDVDLSSRLTKAGWRVVFDPSLVVHHCRGWKRRRREMPAAARRQSLANDWKLWRKGSVPRRVRAPMLAYLTAKSLWVRVER